MTIAIMSAMHEENASIVQAMEVSSEKTIGARTYVLGRLLEQDVIVVFSHWGKVAASITATTLITHFDVKEIIFTGVAGAIKDTLFVGDIIIGNRLYQHDMDASPIIQRHEIPLLGCAYITSNAEIQKKLKLATTNFIENDLFEACHQNELSNFNITRPSVVIADIASGDQFISDAVIAKDISARLPSVACVEMEGAAVAQVCEAFGVPFGLVRTISDAANETSDVDFLAFIEQVAQAYSLGILKRYLSD